MRYFFPLYLVFMVTACQTFGGRKSTVSGWIAFDDAADVDCAKWPLHPKDLQTNDLTFISGPHGGFVASVMKRDGSSTHYFASFDGDVEIDADQLKPLSLGRGAIVAGGGSHAGTPYGVVVQNNAGKAHVEIRNLSTNVIKAKADLPGGDVRNPVMLWSATAGFWMAYEAASGGQLAWFDLEGEKLKVTPKGSVSFNTPPMLISGNNSDVLVVSRQGEVGSPLHGKLLNSRSTKVSEHLIPAQVSQGLESWAVASHQGAYIVGLVDGDSLVGQANLRVAHIDWGSDGPRKSWTKNQLLKDVHVSEPVFLPTNKGLELLLLNWVDEESTIARYMVASGQVSKPKYSGIFPKGSRIVAAFASTDRNDAYVIVRSRDDERWSFQICQI